MTKRAHPHACTHTHAQERIRNDITAWLKWLKNSIGFDGWRLDFVRGFPGETLKTYIDETVPSMAFGEFWDRCGERWQGACISGGGGYDQDLFMPKQCSSMVVEGFCGRRGARRQGEAGQLGCVARFLGNTLKTCIDETSVVDRN
eukprot:364464-Chlamydomonas_euryale.AAC.3